MNPAQKWRFLEDYGIVYSLMGGCVAALVVARSWADIVTLLLSYGFFGYCVSVAAKQERRIQNFKGWLG